MKRKNYVNIGVIFIAAVLCGIYFYSQLIHIQVPIHSDDAAMSVDFDNIVHNGGKMYWRNYLNIFYYLNLAAYKIWGGTEFMLQMVFAFKYFLCILLAMPLACYNASKKEFNIAILPIFIFLAAMPANSNMATIQILKFHVDSTIYLLLFLCILQFVKELKLKWYVILFGICCIGITDGDILIAVVLWLPILLYFCYTKWKNGILSKNIKYIVFLLAIILVIARFVFGNIGFSGYGSRNFSSMKDIVTNVGIGIQGLMQMFNILIIGEKILQVNTGIYIIRLIILLISMFVVVKSCISLIKKEEIGIINTILVFSILCVISAYVFSGSQDDLISVRYMSSLNYTLPILFCRKFCMDKAFDSKFYLKKINILVLSAVLLIIALIQPISLHRSEFALDKVATAIEQNPELHDGIGGYWVGNVINVLTQNHNVVQAVQLKDGKVNYYLNEWENYMMGSNYFNFLIEDQYIDGESDERGGITKKTVTSMYGEPKETIQVEGRTIYRYDYDIRTAPFEFNFDNAYHVVMEDSCEYDDQYANLNANGKILLDHLYLPIGVQRISIEGQNLSDALQLKCEDSNIKINLESVSSTKLVYQIQTNDLKKNLQLTLINTGINTSKVDKFNIVHEKDSIELEKEKTGKYSFEADKGLYNITFKGKNLKNLNINVESNGNKVDVKRVNNGDEYISFEYKASESGNVVITPSKKVLHTYIETPYEKRTSSELNYSVNQGIHTNQKVEIKDNSYVLNKDQVTFGPYITLSKGKYLVHISGKNLAVADIHVTANSGEKTFDVKKIMDSPNYQELQLDLDQVYNNIEIVVKNETEQNVCVKNYTISEE